MTKSELKTGMIVTNARGEHMMVFKGVLSSNFNGDCFVELGNTEEWDDMDNYNEDLTHDSSDLSIVKVYIANHPAVFFTEPLKYLKIYWERKD